MAANDWGSWEWNESHFPKDQLETTGDTWGIRWRGMEKMRHSSYLSLIKDDLQQTHPLNVLDIGCALCDFTEKAWKLNPNNKFWCMDMSANAIAWATDRFPMFNFEMGNIPDIPFDVEFDAVFCLEVLCYLDDDGRKKTIENIHRVLAPSGKLMFSGVLDGGIRHHTEDEVIKLFRHNFEIRRIEYNHWSFYRKMIENPLNSVAVALTSLAKVLKMPNDDFQNWQSNKTRKLKSYIAKAFRLANPVSIWFVNAVSRLVKMILGWKHLALIAHWLSKVTRGSDKADEIVVLAVNKS
jgi:SAM-dependent methyltransferase